MENYKIRPARQSDWPQILEISAEYVWAQLPLDRRGEGSLAMVRANLERRIQRIQGSQGVPNEAFVMEDPHGLLAGYIWLCEKKDEWTSQKEGFILDLYVNPELRGRGLGRRLMQWAEQWAQIKGYRHLSFSIFPSNDVTRQLSDSLGYRMDSLRMRKRL